MKVKAFFVGALIAILWLLFIAYLLVALVFFWPAAVASVLVLIVCLIIGYWC